MSQMIKARTFLLFAVSLCWSGLGTQTIRSQTNNFMVPLPESAAQHDARMEWWRDARFGMFIHWGLYSEAAGYWNGKPTKDGWQPMNLKLIELTLSNP